MLKAFLGKLLAEDERQPYDKNKYASRRPPPPPVYGDRNPQSGGEEGKGGHDLGCWIIPSQGSHEAPVTAASRQLVNTHPAQTAKTQIAVSEPPRPAGGTQALFSPESFMTPWETTEPVVARGSLVNTYTGEVAQVFEDAMPPPNRSGDDGPRQRKSAALRKIYLDGNAPTGHKRESEVTLPPGDAGLVSSHATHQIYKDIATEWNERTERDKFMTRHEMAPTELEMTRNPFGFSGFHQMMRIYPDLPHTQSLDNLHWSPPPTDPPTELRAPPKEHRLRQDVLPGRMGPAGHGIDDPKQILSEVRRSVTRRNLDGQDRNPAPHADAEGRGGHHVAAQHHSRRDRVVSTRTGAGHSMSAPTVASAEAVRATLRGNPRAPALLLGGGAALHGPAAVLSAHGGGATERLPRPPRHAASSIQASRADASEARVREHAEVFARGSRQVSVQAQAAKPDASLSDLVRPETLYGSAPGRLSTALDAATAQAAGMQQQTKRRESNFHEPGRSLDPPVPPRPMTGSEAQTSSSQREDPGWHAPASVEATCQSAKSGESTFKNASLNVSGSRIVFVQRPGDASAGLGAEVETSRIDLPQQNPRSTTAGADLSPSTGLGAEVGTSRIDLPQQNPRSTTTGANLSPSAGLGAEVGTSRNDLPQQNRRSTTAGADFSPSAGFGAEVETSRIDLPQQNPRSTTAGADLSPSAVVTQSHVSKSEQLLHGGMERLDSGNGTLPWQAPVPSACVVLSSDSTGTYSRNAESAHSGRRRPNETVSVANLRGTGSEYRTDNSRTGGDVNEQRRAPPPQRRVSKELIVQPTVRTGHELSSQRIFIAQGSRRVCNRAAPSKMGGADMDRVGCTFDTSESVLSNACEVVMG